MGTMGIHGGLRLDSRLRRLSNLVVFSVSPYLPVNHPEMQLYS